MTRSEALLSIGSFASVTKRISPGQCSRQTFQRLPTRHAKFLVGQFCHGLLDHRQMRIVPPTRAGSLWLLSAPPLGLCLGGLQIVESERLLGAVVFFRLGAVEPIFQLSVFAAKQVDFPLKFSPFSTARACIVRQ